MKLANNKWFLVCDNIDLKLELFDYAQLVGFPINEEGRDNDCLVIGIGAISGMLTTLVSIPAGEGQEIDADEFLAMVYDHAPDTVIDPNIPASAALRAKQLITAIRVANTRPNATPGQLPEEPVEALVAQLLAELAPGSLTERAPTTWAYEQACKALAASKAKGASLQAFKDFVHTTLDNAGVDKHEEQNATTGCRVGARLQDLISAAQAAAIQPTTT